MFYLIVLIANLFLFLPGLKANPFPQGYQSGEYKVNFTDHGIYLDGKLSEEDWKNCPCTENFVFNEKGQSARFKTFAQILWDDSNLYFAFTIFDKDIWATKTNHDDRIWDEEVIEIFIDPDGDGLNYFELQVNALGAVTDILMDKEYSKGGSADFTWTAESLKKDILILGSINDEKEDSLWICELAVPFSSFHLPGVKKALKPKPDDVWQLNMCRIETDRFDDKEIETTCWSQTDARGFHAPDKFGRIIFTK